MGRPRSTRCKGCGGHIDQVGPLSRNRKLCEDCGISRQTEAIVSISYQSGDTYSRYLSGLNAWTERLNAAANSNGSANPAPSSTNQPPRK